MSLEKHWCCSGRAGECPHLSKRDMLLLMTCITDMAVLNPGGQEDERPDLDERNMLGRGTHQQGEMLWKGRWNEHVAGR